MELLSVEEANAAVERLQKRLERERRARAEAEQIAENGLRSLYAKQQEIELLQDVSSASNEAKSLNEALLFAIERTCRHTGWPVGHVYCPDPIAPDVLVSTGLWSCTPPDKYDAFREKTAETPLPSGVGLPGRVLSTRKPVWIPDVSVDSNFPRAPWAMRAGLRAGYAFGVFVDGEVAAVLEFFSRDRIEMNESLLEAMGHIATQISRVVERERYAERIQFLAYHDTLTGLPNRRLLKDRLDIALDQAARHGRQMAALFLDLDRFKGVNDSLGHKGGDHLLVQLAERLRECVRKGDTVARWAGDEFVVILPEVESESDVRDIAERILASVQAPFSVHDHDLYLTFSIGATMFPWCGETADTMLKCADIALYRAKQRGRNRFELFTEEVAQETESAIVLEANLRRAVARNEFVLHYQPQVDIKSRRIVGLEALVRWRHPEMGTISPMQFIPVAEETGLIVPIGYWVLETACRQAKQWQAEGAGDLRISVNVSLRQFQEPDFAKRIAAILHATGLAPNLLDLEITESVAIENLQAILVTISAIKKLGVHFSLDDFGTGYSSLSNLADLPMDSVKIDKSFIQTMLTAPRNAAIARSIISMARSLNLEVIAEGVEESQQLEFLEAHDCDTMQGFLFSKPVDADRLAEMLGLSDNSVRVAA